MAEEKAEQGPPHATNSDTAMRRAAVPSNRRIASAPGPHGPAVLPRPQLLTPKRQPTSH